MQRKDFLKSLALSASMVAALPNLLNKASGQDLSSVSDPLKFGEKIKTNWKGNWISHEWQQDTYPLISHRPLAFRKDFELPALSQKAVFNITAFWKYRLWINDVAVCFGPARSYTHHYFYDTVDVSHLLKKGLNHIAVLVQPPSGVTGYSHYGRIGLFLDGLVTCTEGNFQIFTDSTWKAKQADWYADHPFLTSLPTGFQEHVIENEGYKNWKTAPAEHNWVNAFQIGPVDAPPWRNIFPRPIPNLIEKKAAQQMVWKGVGGKEIIDLNNNLAIHFANDQTVKGKLVDVSNADQTLSWEMHNLFVFDFGKTRLIRPLLEVLNIKGKVRFELYYSLGLNERPEVMRGFEKEREGFADSFTPLEGKSVWESFGPRGCRFITIKITGEGSGEFRFAGNTIDYPFAEKSSFTTDDIFFKDLWSKSAASLRSSCNDAIVDTCSRENVSWTLDSCHQGKANYYTFGETKIWRRALVLIGDGIDQDGIPKAVNPSESSFMILIDQSLQWINSCYDYYILSGDITLLKEIHESAKRLLNLCIAYITNEGLFTPPAFSWHWIDWADINKENYSLPVNLIFLQALEAEHKISTLLKDQLFQKKLDAVIYKLRKVIPKFYDTAEGRYNTHIEPIQKDIPINRFLFPANVLKSDLHSNALACILGCGTIEQRKSVANFISKAIEGPLNPQNIFSPCWMEIILSPVIEYGYIDAVVKFLHTAYGKFIEAGSPTWGETFVGGDSYQKDFKYNTAHGWGAVVNTLIVEKIIGLRCVEAGWKKAVFDPKLGNIKSLEYSLTTTAGDIKVSIQEREIVVYKPAELNLECKLKLKSQKANMLIFERA